MKNFDERQVFGECFDGGQEGAAKAQADQDYLTRGREARRVSTLMSEFWLGFSWGALAIGVVGVAISGAVLWLYKDAADDKVDF